MRMVRVGLMALALALVGVCAGARADEKKIPLDQVPKAVLDAARKHFPGAQLRGAEIETEKGKTMYEIALTHKGQKYDAIFTATGTLTEYERVIATAELPAVVRQAVDKKYPKCTIRRVEAETRVNNGKHKLAGYEIQITTSDNKKHEVVVTPNGQIKEGDED